MTRILVFTHLQSEDRFLIGLTLTQALAVVVAAMAGLLLFLASPATWPLLLRGGLGTIVLAAGLVLGLIAPGGRGLDDWVGIVLAYGTRPRLLRWRKGDAR